MSLVIELPYHVEQCLEAEAEKEGVSPETLAIRVMKEKFTPDISTEEQHQRNAFSIDLLKSWIADAPKTQIEKREAENAVKEFKEHLDAPRKTAGARLLFPEKN
jgi:hypothetical protein